MQCLPVAQRPAQKLPPKHLCARSRASGAPQALPAAWGCVTPLPVPLAWGMRGRDPSVCDDPAALTQHGPSSAGPTATPRERALGRQRRGLHPWAEEGPGGIRAGPAPQRGGEHLCCLRAHSTCLPGALWKPHGMGWGCPAPPRSSSSSLAADAMSSAVPDTLQRATRSSVGVLRDVAAFHLDQPGLGAVKARAPLGTPVPVQGMAPHQDTSQPLCLGDEHGTGWDTTAEGQLQEWGWRQRLSPVTA